MILTPCVPHSYLNFMRRNKYKLGLSYEGWNCWLNRTTSCSTFWSCRLSPGYCKPFIIICLTEWAVFGNHSYFLAASQMAKKFYAFCITRIFIALFWSARHVSLSWGRWMQFTSFHSIPIICILISSSCLKLVLSCGLCYTGFLGTTVPCTLRWT